MRIAIKRLIENFTTNEKIRPWKSSASNHPRMSQMELDGSFVFLPREFD